MGRDASVELDWATGRFTFRLAWGELISLQEELDSGPFVILARLSGDECMVEDISTVIRLALIGGGTEPAKALALVKDYVESRPPSENKMFARGVLALGLYGPSDETPGKPEQVDQAPG